MHVSSIFFFVWKTIFFVAVFIWVRASVPRYRYDQLMRLGWKILLPLTLGCLLFFIGIFYYFSLDIKYLNDIEWLEEDDFFVKESSIIFFLLAELKIVYKKERSLQHYTYTFRSADSFAIGFRRTQIAQKLIKERKKKRYLPILEWHWH